MRLPRVLRAVLSVSLVLAWATPILAATTVFQWLFDTQFGVVNWILAQLGADTEGHSWFSTGPSTFFVAGLLVVWQAVPFVVFSVSAALATVPPAIQEAAVIDGATAWQRWWSISFPLLRPIFGILAFLQVIWDFKAFTQVYAIRRGGPTAPRPRCPSTSTRRASRAASSASRPPRRWSPWDLLVLLAFYVRVRRAARRRSA